MYAIVEIAGKQYKVQEKDKLVVPRLSADVDDSVTFDRVLLVSSGDDVQLGTPVLDNATVTAKIVEHFKGDKVLVFRKKRRKRFKVKRGHRQPYTRIEVSGLSLDGKKKASKTKAEEKSETGEDTKEETKASKAKAKAPKADTKAAGKAEAKAAEKSEAKAAEKTDTESGSKKAEKKAEKKSGKK